MKRLYFDDEQVCSEAYPQQFILQPVACAMLSALVIGTNAQNTSTLFRPPDLRMFAANEKVFKLFSNHSFFDSKIQHKTFENKINIG